MCTYRLSFAVFGGVALLWHPLAAQVVTDGTTGDGVALEGPDYEIGADLGTRAGDNLFHSFDEFSIDTGESATFTGPGGIDNIISRVTGGEISTIDGLIASTIPGASLWLFNPSGVVFGANASLDVSGSFHVSTADELRTADGGKFSAINPESSGFSIAEPQSFGFLGADPAGITIAGSQLELDEGQTLSVVGGDVDITAGASLVTDGGQLNVLAAGGTADADVASGEITGTADGDIGISDNTILSSRGDGGGTVRIQGGAFVLDSASTIASFNTGETDSDVGVSIDVKTAEISDSFIATEAQAGGDGGSIDLQADSIQVTDARIATSTSGAGDGGDINVSGDEIALRDRGLFFSLAEAGGNGGTVRVEAGELSIVDSNIASSTLESSSGEGGDLLITAGSLEVITGDGPAASFIGTGAFGSGDAGDIDIRGRDVLVDGGDALNRASIQSVADGAGSAAGEIRIRISGRLDLVQGGVVLTEAAAGTSGVNTIEVSAKEIVIDDGSAAGTLTGINIAVSSEEPSSGQIIVRADDLQIRNGGEISSITAGASNAGDITVTAGNITIAGGDEPAETARISSATVPGSTGDAGTITIAADRIDMSGNGQILGTTLGDGDAGIIRITADSGIRLQDASAISTNAGSTGAGNAGSIVIDTSGLIILDRGRILSATAGSGDAGSIDITARTALFDADNNAGFSGVTTQSAPGSSGNAGDITLRIDDLTLRASSEISSNAFGSGNAGVVAVTSETITIDSADSNPRFLTGITTSVEPGGGDAGAISIKADQLVLRGDNAQILSVNDSDGAAGTVDIELTDSLVLVDGGDIFTNSVSGGGGGITIKAGTSITATGPDSVITTSVADDTGDAGDIVIEAPVLALGAAAILARADGGQGGDIQISVDDLILSPDAEINAEAGATGVDGTVAITSPEADLTAGLVALDGRFLDVSALLRERCSARREETSSSFTLGTGGAIPPDLDAPRLSLRPAADDQAALVREGERTVLVLPCPKASS